jgi:hypothetical protein
MPGELHDRYLKLTAPRVLAMLGEVEDRRLDFKEVDSALTSRDDKRNLACALSGFANAEGGVVLWGVTAARDGVGQDQFVEFSSSDVFLHLSQPSAGPLGASRGGSRRLKTLPVQDDSPATPWNLTGHQCRCYGIGGPQLPPPCRVARLSNAYRQDMARRGNRSHWNDACTGTP